MKKLKYFLSILFLFLLVRPLFATEINNFQIYIEILSPNSAKITENWLIDAADDLDLLAFKEQILEANVNLEKLKKINFNLTPHIYINKYTSLSVEFDEINRLVKLEYLTEDLILEEYLDFKDQILWRFNENLLRHFITKGNYDIPRDSLIRVCVKEPLVIEDALPKGEIEKRQIIWTGITSNEIRLFVVEKKIPKATFNVSDFFNTVYLKGTFYYVMMVILFIILILLLFKKDVSKKIKSFVRKHSIIKPKKQINEIIDIDFIDKND